MEKYRKTLKLRLGLILCLMAASVIICCVDQFTGAIPSDTVIDFIRGLCIGLEGLCLVLIGRYRKALRSDAALQLCYNRENDERMKAIRSKSGMPMLMVTSLLMLLAGMIAGYFNLVVFYTLVLAAAGQMLIACVVKLVYKRIM